MIWQLEASLSDLLLRSGLTEKAKEASSSSEKLDVSVTDFIETIAEKKTQYLRSVLDKMMQEEEAEEEDDAQEKIPKSNPFSLSLDEINRSLKLRIQATESLMESLL